MGENKAPTQKNRLKFEAFGISYEGPKGFAYLLLAILAVGGLIKFQPVIGSWLHREEPPAESNPSPEGAPTHEHGPSREFTDHLKTVTRQIRAVKADLQQNHEGHNLAAFVPSGFSRAMQLEAEAATTEDPERQRLLYDRCLTFMKTTLKQSQRRQAVFSKWHGWEPKPNGERRLSGASGRYIGFRSRFFGSLDGRGTMTSRLVVTYWVKSNNHLFGAKGIFRIRSPFLNEELPTSCGPRSRREKVAEFPLNEEVLFNFEPDQLSISRDYE